MKTYIASVKDNGSLKIITSDYNRKEDFAKELRANGYRVRFISTEENFDKDAERYNVRLERQAEISRFVREYKKNH